MAFNSYVDQFLSTGKNALTSAQGQAQAALQQSINNQKKTLQNNFSNQSSTAREQTEAIKRNLLNALTQNKTNVQQQRTQTQEQYLQQKNQTSVDHALEQKRLREVMAQQGLSTGDSMQSMLMANIGRQGALGGLARQENSVYDQLARTLEQYQMQYQDQVSGADNELTRLLRDYENRFNTETTSLQQNYDLQLSQLANEYAQKQAELQAEAARMQYEYELEQEAQAAALAAQRAAASRSYSSSSSKPATIAQSADAAKADMSNFIWSNPTEAYKALTDPEIADHLKANKVYDDLMLEYKAAATELRRTTNLAPNTTMKLRNNNMPEGTTTSSQSKNTSKSTASKPSVASPLVANLIKAITTKPAPKPKPAAKPKPKPKPSKPSVTTYATRAKGTRGYTL